MDLTGVTWAAAASSVAAIASLAVTVVNAGIAYQLRVEERISRSAELLLAKEAMDAREVVGSVSRRNQHDPLKGVEVDQFRQASFRLIWTIHTLDSATPGIRKTRLGRYEARRLFQQLNSVVPELSKALAVHGKGIDWQDSGKIANTVLDRLPKDLKDEWGRKMVKLTDERLPVGVGAVSNP